MQQALDETSRRREKQTAYNPLHQITPQGIVKAVKEIIDGVSYARPAGMDVREYMQAAEEAGEYDGLAPNALGKLLARLEKQMFGHAKNLEFEQAAAIRNRIQAIKARNLGVIENRSYRA